MRFLGSINANSQTVVEPFTLPNGAGTLIRPRLSEVKYSGFTSIGVGVMDGTRNRRVGLFADDTNNLVGISFAASASTPDFVVRGPSSELLRVYATGGISVGAGTGSVACGSIASTGSIDSVIGDTGYVRVFRYGTAASGQYLELTSNSGGNILTSLSPSATPKPLVIGNTVVDGSISTSTYISFELQGTEFLRITNSTLIPGLSYNIGSSGQRFGTIYGVSVDLNNTLTAPVINATSEYQFGGRTVFRISSTNVERGGWNPFWSASSAGNPLYFDEEFAVGMNSVFVYNNAGGTKLTITRQTGQVNVPNSTGCWLKISYDGTGTPNSDPQPGYGGFVLLILSQPNRTFVQRFIAKIPSGYQIDIAENSVGAGGGSYWMTSQLGTGKWEQYIRVCHCGTGQWISSVSSIANGGTGYAVGNVLTVQGGTLSPGGVAAQLQVTSVTSGVITGVSVTNVGSYTTLPTNPVSVTGGAGSGATFNLSPQGFSSSGYVYVNGVGANTAFDWYLASVNIYEMNMSGFMYLNASNLTQGTIPNSRLASLVSATSFKATGLADFSGSGAGLEMYYDGENAGLNGYNRSTSQYTPILFNGSWLTFYIQGSPRWAVDSSGHFVPSASNTYNIGSSGARVSGIYSVSGDFSGTVNANAGFRVGGAVANDGYYLRGNGTNFVASLMLRADITTSLGGDTIVSGASDASGYNRGDWQIATTNTSVDYTGATLELRERNFAGAQTATFDVAPRLAFHFGGRIATQVSIHPTDGYICILDGAGTSYGNFRCNDLNCLDTVTSNTFTSIVATGTAPLTVTSTTLVAHLNAELLNGNASTFYTNASNLSSGTIPSARLSGSYTGITAVGALTCNGVQPSANNTYTSGASGARWSTLYSVGANLSGDLTVSGISGFIGDAQFDANLNCDNTVTASNLSSTTATFSGAVTFSGGASAISLTAATSMINFGSGTANPPTLTTARSTGTKIIIYNGFVPSIATDYAIGVEPSNLWFSTSTTSSGFKWYGGATLQMSLIGSALSTGSISASSIAASSINTNQIYTTGATDLLLQTNSTTRWKILSGGDFVPNADRTYNIGGSGLRIATTFTDKIIVYTSLRIPGAAPASPQDGDLWYEAAYSGYDLKLRVGGVTYDFAHV